MATLDFALLRGLVANWSYRWGLHGNLGVTRHDIELPAESKLPAPLVLAFASDFHAGPSTHPDMFATLMEELTHQQPDVLLLGGDFVSCRARYVDVLAEFLSHCSPSMGK